MEIYGLIVTHLWLVSLVVLYIGYLTYADYYDKFSDEFMMDYKILSLVTTVISFVIFAAALPDAAKKVSPWEMYVGISCLCSWILSIGTVVLFVRHSGGIRQYFGRKRNKV
ncbi:hypothetical protein XbC2_569 [Xanthomonas phage XbC2]|nr:hypothetical protein XbC2_569 [Xanthomonas phage XbC2]